ncbi:MAG: MFS transporter [Rhizobiales bacterium]|nr:MFS transporter [Hyphomicrobiales bacterium]NRB15327.1 MFS transporter [Hyphomicrobiales bacterium]
MFAAAKEFNKTVWFIILATFMSRFTFLMVWPFLALILYNDFGLNELEIGIFMTLAVSIGVGTGLFMGNLSDRIGRRKVIMAGLFLTIIAMFGIANASDIYIIWLATTIASIARGMVEDPGKALMTDMMGSREAKDLAIQMRYFFLNVGAAFGPLTGVYIGIGGQQSAFNIVAVGYIAYLALAVIIFRLEKPLSTSHMGKDQSLGALFKLLRSDHAFMIFVFATFLISLAYAQIDIGLIQFLRLESFENVAKLYGILLFTNGMTIILFQFPILKLLENVAPMKKAYLGAFLFTLGFFVFSFTYSGAEWMLILAMFIMSLGEVIVFPTINIVVDRMAPTHLKGSYFGASGLGYYGWAFAPILGGWLLHSFGGQAMWLVMTLISAAIIPLFYIAQTAKRPNFAAVED